MYKIHNKINCLHYHKQTSLLIAFFALALVVPRACRVALAFALATALASAVIGVRALGGARLKSARAVALAPKVSWMNASSACRNASRAGILPFSAASATFTAACAVVTARMNDKYLPRYRRWRNGMVMFLLLATAVIV